MDKISDLVIAALISAFVGGMVNLFFEYLKGKFKDKDVREIINDNWRRFLIYVFLGLVIGAAGWLLISRWYEKTLWTFQESDDAWGRVLSPDDASMRTEWNGAAKALQAEFDFGQIDPNKGNPRASFYIDHLEGEVGPWTGYKTLTLDVTNDTAHPLKLIFSVYVGKCFYEYGGFRNLPSKASSTTVHFDFTKPLFKSCNSPIEFDQPLDPSYNVRRLDLIFGTNAEADELGEVKGALLIDNIRLQRDVWLFRLAVIALVLVILGVPAFLEYRRQKPLRPRKKR